MTSMKFRQRDPELPTTIARSSLRLILCFVLFFVSFRNAAVAQETGALPPEAASKFAVAVEAHKAGQLDVAADNYRFVLRDNPNFAPALLNLGLIEFAQHHLDKSLQLLTRVTMLSPDSETAWLFVGLSSYQMNDFISAEQPLKQAVTLRPNNEKALLFLGQTYNALGRYRDAADVLQKAKAIDSKDTETMYALSQAYMHLAVEASALLRETDPHNVRVYQMSGQMYAENQNFNAAVQEFQELVKRYPTLPGGHGMLGKAYDSIGNNPDALAAYKLEISIDPYDADMYARAGNLMMESGDKKEGVTYLKRALELDSRSEIAEVAYGKYLLHQNQSQEALTVLKRAEDFHSQNKNVHFLLAQAYRQTGRLQDAERERGTFEELNKAKESEREKGPASFVDASGKDIVH